jgi:hypothetical protein
MHRQDPPREHGGVPRISLTTDDTPCKLIAATPADVPVLMMFHACP